MKTMAAKLVTSLLFAVLVPSTLFATDYRYTVINFPNESGTIARSINARGDIVGKYTDADGVGHGYLLHNGVFSTIDFPNALSTGPRGINARGDIVGAMTDANDNGHGFLLHDGQFTQIDYPGAPYTAARGINNAGDITGTYDNASGKVSGFILKDGKYTNIRVLDAASTDVYMAQDNGRVMVGDTILKSDGGNHGFVRQASGEYGIIDFPGLAFPCTFARWVNERGDIAGFFAYVNSADECFSAPPAHGFLLRDGQYTVTDFPGTTNDVIQGINDDGVLVGIVFDPKGASHGFKAVPIN